MTVKAAIRRGKGKPLHAVAHSARGDKGVSHMWFDEIKARMGDNRCFARCRLMDASRRPMRPSQTNVSPPSPIEAPSSHPSLPAALEYGTQRRVDVAESHIHETAICRSTGMRCHSDPLTLPCQVYRFHPCSNVVIGSGACRYILAEPEALPWRIRNQATSPSWRRSLHGDGTAKATW